MKVNRPTSPLSGGAEPVDPLDARDLRKAVKGAGFADALSQLEAQSQTGGAQPTTGAGETIRAALASIAASRDLSDEDDATEAVRESSRVMIGARLAPEQRETERGQDLLENLSEFVSNDPLLKTKLLSILKKLQSG